MMPKKPFTLIYIYLLTFLSSVHYALVIYINSSFLENFLSKGKIGILYAASATMAIWGLIKIPSLLKKWGQLKLAVSIVTINLCAILGLAAVSYSLLALNLKTTLFAVLFFLVFQVAVILTRFSLDLYLEEFSKDSQTGLTRGIFLTVMNTAIAMSPFFVGLILVDGNFWSVYLTAAIFLILAIFVITNKLSWIKDINYRHPPFLETFRNIKKNKNIYNIFVSNLLLEFFYSWMVIYTPIYLNQTIGFSWQEIGSIFSLMLLAFVIFQLPMGRIADKYMGEKEILTIGYLIIGLSTVVLTFISIKDFWVWAVILFITRVGASFIEIMNETYFFKKVRATDSNIISFFRNAQPLAYILGPVTASFLLLFVDYKYLFAILGVIMLFGIKYSLTIKDTL